MLFMYALHVHGKLYKRSVLFQSSQLSKTNAKLHKSPFPPCQGYYFVTSMHSKLNRNLCFF